MPTTTLPRRAATLAAGVTVALALVPVPALAEPPDEPGPERVAASADGLEKLVEEHTDLQEELRYTRARIAALTDQLVALERRLKAQRDQIGLVAATHRTRGTNPMAALAGTRSSTSRVDPLLTLERLDRRPDEVVSDLSRSTERLLADHRVVRDEIVLQHAREQQLSGRNKQIEAEINRLNRLRTEQGGAPPSTESGAERAPAPPPAGLRVVRFAYAQLGKNYRWAGSGPNGYDCSGLTLAAWATVGVKLPHNAAQQWRVVTRINRAALRPGDLVFYYRHIGHVGIYVGNDKVIHAPRPGRQIRVDKTDFQPVHGYGRPR
ncbi:NlpC/P60 family protein [Micromonospora sp. NPDC003197]